MLLAEDSAPELDAALRTVAAACGVELVQQVAGQGQLATSADVPSRRLVTQLRAGALGRGSPGKSCPCLC